MDRLSFLFKPEVSLARQEALLAEMVDWPGVRQAFRLTSDLSDQFLRRFCFIVPAGAYSTGELRARLEALEEVEVPEQPAGRWLL